MNKYEFLHPHSRYHGDFTPENFLFDANLQEFATRVSYIAGLENSGKLSPQEAYEQIKSLWQELKASKKALLDTVSSS
ncbi:hypothetical protein [Thermosynechococcus sp.]|uniref:DUF7219 family protein n=1 Tax=Thermosynechococcus sp. TaxID=2814275 RepID=UPI00391D0AC3